MDTIRVTPSQPQVERPMGTPPPLGRARPQSKPEEAEQTDQQAAQQTAQSQSPPEKDDVEAAAQELALRFNLKMEVVWDDKSGQDILKVMSPDGKRLLRQFPPEAVLALAERLRNGGSDGLLTSLA